MGRRKKKPNGTTEKSMQEIMREVVAAYGDEFDDRIPVGGNHATLRDVVHKCDITMLKARKILITAGKYSTALSRQIQELHVRGLNIQAIMKITELSRASVHSYLPYDKIVYKLPERSTCADRMKLSRDRKWQCERFKEELPYIPAEEARSALWNLIEAHQGCVFQTAKGLEFRYKVKGGEIFVDRKKDSITKATVWKALENVMERNGEVKGPKKIGVFGASYLWGMFVRFGVISNDAKQTNVI